MFHCYVSLPECTPPENSWLEHPKTGGFVDVDVFPEIPLGQHLQVVNVTLVFRYASSIGEEIAHGKREQLGPGKLSIQMMTSSLLMLIYPPLKTTEYPMKNDACNMIFSSKMVPFQTSY